MREGEITGEISFDRHPLMIKLNWKLLSFNIIKRKFDANQKPLQLAGKL